MERDVTKRLRSRHAAQSRRLNENSEFEHLAQCLPIPRPISSQLLDKASIVRLTVSCLRFHHFSVRGYPNWLNSYQFDNVQNGIDLKIGAKILEALDGFLFCLSENGTVLYVSETVSVGLGLSQIEMIGNNFAEYVHPNDQHRWHSILAALTVAHTQGESVQLLVRIRSTLTKRACRDNAMRSCVGHKVVQLQLCGRYEPKSFGARCLGVTGLGVTLPYLASASVRLDAYTFVITTHLNLTVHYMDTRAEELLGYCNSATSARGVSLYAIVHPEDLNSLIELHKDAIELGGCASQYLRLISIGGQHFWVFCSATRISKHKAGQHLNYISLCINVISREHMSASAIDLQSSQEICWQQNALHPICFDS